MGRRGGSGTSSQERLETAPLTVPVMQDREAVQAPSYQEDKLDKILEAIKTTGQDLQSRVDAVVIEVTLLREDQQKLSARVTSAESDLKDLRPSLTAMEETISAHGVSFFFTEPTDAWDWVEQRRYETPGETPPAVQSVCSTRKKIAGTPMQGAKADRRRGNLTPAKALWHEDGEAAQ
ncbi:hypothetical protein NDU88_004898 [Pleurodeles waltl]|uniref:Uncharacterized protein n=1 Tax=Pleurodeles waltl TaxID=8319 RepID=A0AAV7TV18_PLEWA|nr:hypothetical protein NDU88_004898 [Pleurodeles waltl]